MGEDNGGFDIKLELEELEIGKKSRGEDGNFGKNQIFNFETDIKEEQLEADFEEEEVELKEAGEVGGDLDMLIRIKQEMEE